MSEHQTTWWEIHVGKAALACRNHLPDSLSETQKDELSILFSRSIRDQCREIQDKAYNYGFDDCDRICVA